MQRTALLINLLFCCLRIGSALEYNDTFYQPGWWLGMSDDSFGFGIPSEADDLHTFGLQGGYKAREFSGSLMYDIYTNRGTTASEHSRTDRLRLLLSWQNTAAFNNLSLSWQLSGCLGLDGNLGGYWVQHLFHYAFLNHRQIPEITDYDALQFFFGLQPSAELALHFGGISTGLELDVLLTWPWLLNLDPGLFFQYRGGDTVLRLAAAWMFTPAADNYRTFGRARSYADGLWLTGYLASGGLFYHFSYNPLRQLTDGRIGFQWSRRTPAQAPPLWTMMLAGIEMYKLGPAVAYEENTFCQLFFASDLPGGLWYLLAKNGGLYADKACTTNAKNVLLGMGYEQHLPVGKTKEVSCDPFIGMDLFIEHLREHDFTAYRSTTLAEMGVLGTQFHAGIDFRLPSLPGHAGITGLRVSAFAVLPHYTFGSGVDSPGLGLAQELRWGIRAGIFVKP